jgi:transforming growth factor-beta-induced protein
MQRQLALYSPSKRASSAPAEIRRLLMRTQRFGLIQALSLAALLTSAAACGSDSEADDETDDAGAVSGDAGNDEQPAAETDAGGVSSDAGNAQVDSGEGADAAVPAKKTIVEIAAGDSRFTSLVAAVKKAGLVEALSAAGPLTVFAPTDQAFAAALATLGKTLDQLSADDLKPILTYHVIGSSVKSTDLKAGPVKMLSGISAFVSTSGGAKINGANVVSADIEASNGVIHVIDKVILPPNLVEAATLAGDFSTLLGAATSAGLAETLAKPDANLTVFAPNNAAFAKLSSVPSGDALKNVLLYHVVSGKVLSTDLKGGAVPTLLTGKSITVDLSAGVKINDAKVIGADVVTTNGVIHVIDTVLIPPS